MNNKRRGFLKTAASIAACSLVPSIAKAEDYSKNNGQYQPHYVYNPFADQKPVVTQQNYQVQNNILPENHGDFWSQPRRVFLNRRDTHEQAEIFYYQNGKLDMDQYWKASYLLRDIHQNQMIYMDPKLLDLVCAVQAWLVYYGVKTPIYVNSGFRTLKTNTGLEGAAKNSMHLYGRAIDFTIPGLSPLSLAKIAAQFRGGGIGIYPSQNFIHLDTGDVRVWVR